METASVSHDEEHQHAVISFADGAKLKGLAALLSVPVCSAGNRQQDLRQAGQHAEAVTSARNSCQMAGWSKQGHRNSPPHFLPIVAWFSSASQPDRQEITRRSGCKDTHYFRNSNENKGISFCSYLAFLSESL